MLFSSSIFIYLFMPITLLGYQLLSYAGRRALLAWLTLTSLFFYGYWNPSYLILLLGSILANFFFSLAVGNETRSERSKNTWLFIAISANLLLLGWFKYLFPLLGFFNRHGFIHHGFGDVILPLGISFFTFTQTAYLIDVRQGVAKPQSLLTYSVFVTFFPHLVAGPIIHPREVIPQLEEGRIGSLRSDDMALGISWFVMGLAKKVLIADRVSPLANALFEHPTSFAFGATWLGSICYAMQLYFDFSGYSDMALGLARMFSIRFPINFNSPFKSPSIIVFWTRWHITLSNYLQEYLFNHISVFMNRRRIEAGKKVSRKAQATLSGFTEMVAIPLLVTMFLAGIWHGAGAQYLVFGLLHGSYLVINHWWRTITPKSHRWHAKLPHSISVVITFVAVLASFVFFRANGIHDAVYVLSSMIGLHGAGHDFASIPWVRQINSQSPFLRTVPSASITVAVCFLMVWTMPNTQEILNQLEHGTSRQPSLFPRLLWRPTMAWSFALSILFCLGILLLDANVPFLYFQF